MTRNSPAWWIGIVGAIVTLLGQQFGLLHSAFPSMGPEWESRIQLLAALVGIVSGYFRMSPLALSDDSTLAGRPADPTKTLSLTGKHALLVGALLVGAASVSGCASTDRFNKLAADLTHDAIVASEQHRCTVHAAPCLTDDQFRTANVSLNKVSVAGREYTKLRIAGTATAGDVHTFLATVAEETAILSKTFKDGGIAAVLAKLTELQQKAVKLLGGN